MSANNISQRKQMARINSSNSGPFCTRMSVYCLQRKLCRWISTKSSMSLVIVFTVWKATFVLYSNGVEWCYRIEQRGRTYIRRKSVRHEIYREQTVGYRSANFWHINARSQIRLLANFHSNRLDFYFQVKKNRIVLIGKWLSLKRWQIWQTSGLLLTTNRKSA